jgi:hypothetical protein
MRKQESPTGSMTNFTGYPQTCICGAEMMLLGDVWVCPDCSYVEELDE